jgi:carbon monoxide dehydrogenase subunit G
MAGFKRSIVINRPVEEVFDFATDLNNASRLLPGVVRTEWLAEGGMKPGARFRETRGVKGKERSAVIEVVEHDRPRLHTAAAAMLGMRAAYTFRFTPEAEGTRVEMDAVVTGNILWKLFLGMLARMMEKEDGDYLVRLADAMTQPGRA